MICRRFLAGGRAGGIGDRVTISKTGSAGRAYRLTLEVRKHVTLSHRGCGALLHFQSPLLDRTIDLPEVIDAGGLLRGGAGAGGIGDGDRNQQADEGNHDHDFDQRETLAARCDCDFHLNRLLFRDAVFFSDQRIDFHYRRANHA